MVTRLNQTDFVKTALRLPPELHAKLHEGAEASGRSYNAELVARLQESFERTHTSHVQAGPSEGRAFLELLVSNMQSQVEMLGLRVEMVKMRARAEEDRIQALTREIELEAKAAQTDDDFARVEEKVKSLSVNRTVLAQLEKELVGVLREREALIAHMTSTHNMLTTARQDLEGRMAEYLERKDRT
jgi:hypothetical protein